MNSIFIFIQYIVIESPLLYSQRNNQNRPKSSKVECERRKRIDKYRKITIARANKELERDTKFVEACANNKNYKRFDGYKTGEGVLLPIHAASLSTNQQNERIKKNVIFDLSKNEIHVLQYMETFDWSKNEIRVLQYMEKCDNEASDNINNDAEEEDDIFDYALDSKFRAKRFKRTSN